MKVLRITGAVFALSALIAACKDRPLHDSTSGGRVVVPAAKGRATPYRPSQSSPRAAAACASQTATNLAQIAKLAEPPQDAPTVARTCLPTAHGEWATRWTVDANASLP